MTVFKADGTGKVALYSGTDDAPFTNPRDNMSRVHFHSEFDYIAFEGTPPDLQVTVSIPTTVSSRFRSISVGPHGKSGIPFVFGQVFVDSKWTPLVGSVPVHVSQTTLGGQWVGHLINWTLELSDTGIFLRECRTAQSFANLPISRTARFWVSENIMD